MGGVYTKLFNKNLWKAPEDKVFIFASLAEKTEKNQPPGGIPEKSMYFAFFRAIFWTWKMTIKF